MKTDLAKRDITKYCEFHRDHGHRTNDFIQLKKEIKFLIRRGHLYPQLSINNLGKDQCDFRGIRRWWGIQFG